MSSEAPHPTGSPGSGSNTGPEARPAARSPISGICRIERPGVFERWRNVMPFQAVVFDIDGTLVDNMPYHVKAWMALFKGRNVEVTEHDFETRFAGTKNQEILRALLPGLDAEEAKRLGDSKEEAYREVYRPKLTAMPGLLHLMDRLDRAGIRMAIASAAPPGNRELVLGGLGITSRFKAIVGAEHVQRGKPFPQSVPRRRRGHRRGPRELCGRRGCPQRRALGRRGGNAGSGHRDGQQLRSADRRRRCVDRARLPRPPLAPGAGALRRVAPPRWFEFIETTDSPSGRPAHEPRRARYQSGSARASRARFGRGAT